MRNRLLAGVLSLVAVVGVVSPAVVSPAQAATEPITALATLAKTASAETVVPGETFTYTLTVGCSSITDTGCRNAVLTDTVPAEFEVISAVVGGIPAATPVVSGQQVTVSFNAALGDGTAGILDATTGVVTVTARVRTDLPYEASGVPVLNQASIGGANFENADSQVPVTPVVPLDLAVVPTKTFTPDAGIAVPGTAVSANLTATNTSNATVDTIVIQDPVDPADPGNPFDILGFQSFGTVTPPAGSTASFEVYIGGAWVPAPGGTPPPGVVRGTRVVFTGSFAPGTVATVPLNLVQTAAVGGLPDTFGVDNVIAATVALGADQATETAIDTYTVQQNTIQVTASKAFDPGVVVGGEPSTVTLGLGNASAFPLDSLGIREPSTGTLDPALTFTGLTGSVVFPGGATAGTITYIDGGGVPTTVPVANGAPWPGPGYPLDEVAAFEVTFSGSIPTGASASLAFGVTTAPVAPGSPPATIDNVVLVTGANGGTTGTAPASDDLYVYDRQLETYSGKQIRPSQINAVAGERVTVSLTGGTTERPDPPTTLTGSTADAQQIVIQDPINPAAPPVDPWWNAFDATAVTQTPIPAGATLTVRYWSVSAGAWVDLPGAVGIAGAQIFSAPIPAGLRQDVGGLQFVYTDPAGFPPGTDLAPNFASSLRETARDGSGAAFDPTTGGFVPNCAATAGSFAAGTPADATSVVPAPCPVIELIPVDPGTGDFVDKTFLTSSSGGDQSVIARSGDTIPARLSWSTDGYSNIASMVITDVVDPETTPIAASVFDAFNLTRVQPVTAATDPLIVFDAVQSVEVYNGTAWVSAANNPCPAACVGQFPGMNLTAAEQASTIGIRLVIVESPQRAAVIAALPVDQRLDAPAVGSGVARSFANTRPLDIVFQVRDVRRNTANPTPVLGSELYNIAGSPGTVLNTVEAEANPVSGAPIISTDSDDVVIIDVPLTTQTDKAWRGGPLGVPQPGTATNAYPLSTISVTTRNTTPARVDTLTIRDPGPGGTTDPFSAFSFNRFSAITVPAGTVSTLVTVFLADGSTPSFSRAQALGLTAASFTVDVVGVQVAFTGRIAAGASGVLATEVRLRPSYRGTTTPVTEVASPVPNIAQGTITDLGGLGGHTATDVGAAAIVLAAPTFTVTAGKTITPATQKEPDDGPVTATITGQPGGSTNAVSMTLTDEDATFWNAFDYVGIAPSFTLSAPIERVRVDYLIGGTFTAGGASGVTVTGATWVDGPGPMTLAQAKTYAAGLPAGLHGLRFTFTKANGADWFDPSYPVQSVPIVLERRTDLRTGGPVPTTRSDLQPAPGETNPGEFWNTVTADGVSDLVGPTEFLTATDTADANYRYLHSQNSVAVLKTPTGDVRPGVVIPFTLQFTNSGETPIENPVFTDRMPMDASGPQLIFDPDRDPSVSPYAVTLQGAPPSPATGTPLPTSAAGLDITVAPDGSSIVFQGPAGSVLEVGQTYTITISLMLRAGLTPDDDILNTAVIRGDRPFDGCSTTLSPDGFECSDDTTVSPLSVPALSTRKYVRAATPHTEPGIPNVISTANGYDCTGAADAQGFYRSPCVPVTLPGDDEIWRFVVTNTGTLPIDQVVSMDHLPTPGDTGLIVVNPRGSAWPARFVGGVQLIPSATTPAGATLTTFYSLSDNPCTADLNPLAAACPSGAWRPLTGAVDPTSVRSLKFVVTFPPGDLFQPGDTLDIAFTTRTTPQTTATTATPIAWNTVAAGGAAVPAAGQRTAVPPTEGRRVGVTYPTGPITIRKVVSGPAAALTPSQFPVQLVCESAGVPIAGLPAITLRPGVTERVPLLPWGAECTSIEGQFGQTSQSINTAVVGGPDDPIGLILVENVFEVARLTVQKTIDAAGRDQNGAAIGYGPFDFTVDCEFLGSEVWALGYSAANPMATTLGVGNLWALTGLPVGAECTVTETDALGAVGTEFRVTSDGTPLPPQTGTSVVTTIIDDATVAVEAVNSFGAGSLDIEKVVVDDAAVPVDRGPFTVQVSCTLTDGSGTRPVWTGEIVLGGDQPLTASVDDIAAGAECTLTETDDGGANSVDISPSTVTIADGETSTITVTNTFLPARLVVQKTVQGAGADLWGSGPFEVTLECERLIGLDPVPIAIAGGPTRILDSLNDYEAAYEGLTVDATCTLTETGAGGATSTQVLASDGSQLGPFTVVEGETTAEVVNTFDVGTVSVAKSVIGGGESLHSDDTFTIELGCTWQGASIVIPGGASRTISVAAPVEYASLPVGADCSLVETDSGGAVAVTMTPADPADPTRALVTIATAATASVTVVNRFDPPLPSTGADRAAAASLLLGGLLVAFGAVLVAWSRRRRFAGV